MRRRMSEDIPDPPIDPPDDADDPTCPLCGATLDGHADKWAWNWKCTKCGYRDAGDNFPDGGRR